MRSTKSQRQLADKRVYENYARAMRGVLFQNWNLTKRLKDVFGIGSVEMIKNHFETHFAPGMNWKNNGSGTYSWEIDHIISRSSVDWTNEENFEYNLRRIYHYRNCVPMWMIDNRKKGKHYKRPMKMKLVECDDISISKIIPPWKRKGLIKEYESEQIININNIT